MAMTMTTRRVYALIVSEEEWPVYLFLAQRTVIVKMIVNQCKNATMSNSLNKSIKFCLLVLYLFSINCVSSQVTVEYCKKGTKGLCAAKVGDPGFACVLTTGAKDCDGTYLQEYD